MTRSRPILSLVTPTYKEAGGLEALVRSVHEVLWRAEIPYELIVVDDNSPDGTAELAEKLSKEYPVVVVRRPGKLGLSSAVIDGWKAGRGEVLGVMDADLSHDPRILPSMVASVTRGTAEVAVGSRYVEGGGMGNWPKFRQIISQVAVFLGSFICPVKDVTSGYLVLRRSVVQGVRLNPIGFKIGLELLVRGQYRHFTEIPYVFQDREKGSSKLNLREVRNYLVQLMQLVAFYLRVRPKRERVQPVIVTTPKVLA